MKNENSNPNKYFSRSDLTISIKNKLSKNEKLEESVSIFDFKKNDKIPKEKRKMSRKKSRKKRQKKTIKSEKRSSNSNLKSKRKTSKNKLQKKKSKEIKNSDENIKRRHSKKKRFLKKKFQKKKSNERKKTNEKLNFENPKKKINSQKIINSENKIYSNNKLNSNNSLYKKNQISNYNLPSQKILEESISIDSTTLINNNIFDKENMILSPIQSFENLSDSKIEEKKEENFCDSFFEDFYKEKINDFYYEKFLEENREVEIRINLYKLSFDCENRFFLESDDLKKFTTINLKWEKIEIVENEEKKRFFDFEINGKELYNLNSGAHKKIRSPPIFLKTNEKLEILKIINLEDLSNFYVKLNIQLNKKNIKNNKHYKSKKKKIKKKLKSEIVKFFHSIFHLQITKLEKKQNYFFGKQTKEFIKYDSKNKSEIQKKILKTILNKEQKENLTESSNFIKNNLNLWDLKKTNENFYNKNLEEKFRKLKTEEILKNQDLNNLIQFIINEKKSYKKFVFDYKGNQPFYFIDYDSKKIIFKMKNGIYVDFEDSLKFVVFFVKNEKFVDFEAEYYKLLAHFIQITKSIKTNVFVNFSNLNLVSLRK